MKTIDKNTKKYKKGYEQFENLMNRVMKHIESSMEEILPDLIVGLADSFSNTDDDELLKERLHQMVKDGFNLWCIERANGMLLKKHMMNGYNKKKKLN